MKILIGIMIATMMILTINIGVYFVSEDYRFFLKKIKYREELVYEQEDISTEVNNNPSREEYFQEDAFIDKTAKEGDDGSGYTFLDILSGESILSNDEETLPELIWTQEQFIGAFESFNLKELDYNSSLFDITTEYPDPYYEYYSEELSVYIFATKNYSDVQKILEVLSYDIPYTLNEVNNFGQSSLYINLDNAYRDDFVRILLKHKNKAFGLKIQKDSYNTVKQILEENLK